MFKRNILIIIFILIKMIGNSQNFKFDVFVGTKLHPKGYAFPSPSQNFIIQAEPILGMTISHKNSPLIFSYRKNLSIRLSSHYFNKTVEHFTNTNTFDIGYNFAKQKSKKNLIIGLGYHSFINRYAFGLRMYGISPFVSFPLSENISFEYRSDMKFKPDLYIIEPENQSINFIYHFREKNKNFLEKKERKIKTSFLVGLNTSVNTYPQPSIRKNHYSMFNLSPSIGLDFFIPKIKTSLSVEKDWWVDFTNDPKIINGYISNTEVKLNYHHFFKNNRKLKLGIGWALVEDQFYQLENRSLVLQGQAGGNIKRWTYNIKGISLAVGYQIFPRINLNLRQIIPTVGENKYNLSRLSLGLQTQIE